MGVLNLSLFKSAAKVFLSALVILTGVVWMTQALRELDLVTTQGQTLWTFLLATALAAPSLALVVAPIALFGAIAFVLNRLNTDSELAALSAAGVSTMQIMKPFVALTIIVAIITGILSMSTIPSSLRTLRDLVTQIRADVVVNVLREGAFTQLDEGITLHVRARTSEGLFGILVEDARDPNQNLVYTAEQGQVVETEDGTFLILERGAVQAKEQTKQDAAIVVFDRYAFNLSPFANGDEVINYRPRERYMGELWNPAPDDKDVARAPGRFRAELHERLVNPLYPVAFMAIAFAALGAPRTSRQGRFVAIVLAVVAVFATRLAGLGINNLVSRESWAVPLLYGVPLAVTAVSFAIALGHLRPIKSPARRRRSRPEPTAA